MSDARGTGRTSAQIVSAPTGAVFVWCNSDTCYARALANRLGRSELKIKPMSWLSVPNVAGCRDVVVIDHAADVSRGEDAVIVDFLAARGMLAQ